MSASLAATAVAVLALLLFSVSTLATRLASDRVDSELGFTVALLVNAALTALLTLLTWPWREQPWRFDARAAALFALAGWFATFLGRWFLFEAVRRLGAARASVFPTAAPLVTALLAWPLLGERPGWGSAVAMVIAFLGLLLVSDAPRTRPAAKPGAALQRPMLAIGLLSVGAYAIGNVLRADAVRAWNEPLIGTLIGAGAACALQLVLMARKPVSLATRLRAADRTGLAWYGVVGATNILAQVCVVSSMRELPAAEVMLITTGTPLLVFPASHWLLRQSEAISARSLAGLALTLAGVGYLVARPLLGSA